MAKITTIDERATVTLCFVVYVPWLTTTCFAKILIRRFAIRGKYLRISIKKSSVEIRGKLEFPVPMLELQMSVRLYCVRLHRLIDEFESEILFGFFVSVLTKLLFFDSVTIKSRV